MDDFDAGWLAGLIDAEGCICAYLPKGKGMTRAIGINMTDIRPLRRVAELVHTITGKKPKIRNYTKHTKGFFRVAVSSMSGIRRLLRVLLPHFVIKKDQASLMWRLVTRDPRAEISEEEQAIVQSLKEAKRNLDPRPKDGQGLETIQGDSGYLNQKCLGWLSGLLEGDGCIYFSHYPTGVIPTISLGLVSLPGVRRAAEIMSALGKHPITIRPDNKGKPNHWQNKWRISTRRKRTIMPVILSCFRGWREKRHRAVLATMLIHPAFKGTEARKEIVQELKSRKCA